MKLQVGRGVWVLTMAAVLASVALATTAQGALSPPATSRALGGVTGSVLDKPKRSTRSAVRAIEENQLTRPPAHGDKPHAQGTVGVVDLNPNLVSPYPADPTGKASGEEVVIGRARAEEREYAYGSHVTGVALLGNELIGFDSGTGEKKDGPLAALQKVVLDQICAGTGDRVCASLLRMESAANQNGSEGHFSVAHLVVGGPQGLEIGAAQSNASMSEDAACQRAKSDSRAARVNLAGNAVASVGRSETESSSCMGTPAQNSSKSSLIELAQMGVPLPVPGCGSGAADVVTGIPVFAPIVCNGDNLDAGVAVREAVALWILHNQAAGSALARSTVSSTEAKASGPRAARVRPIKGSGPRGVRVRPIKTSAQKRMNNPLAPSGDPERGDPNQSDRPGGPDQGDDTSTSADGGPGSPAEGKGLPSRVFERCSSQFIPTSAGFAPLGMLGAALLGAGMAFGFTGLRRRIGRVRAKGLAASREA